LYFCTSKASKVSTFGPRHLEKVLLDIEGLKRS
jgi:hypothetical protein